MAVLKGQDYDDLLTYIEDTLRYETDPDQHKFLSDVLHTLKYHERQHHRWQKAIVSITPGGSEYCDPEYTAEFLRKEREATMKLKKDYYTLKKFAKLEFNSNY